MNELMCESTFRKNHGFLIQKSSEMKEIVKCKLCSHFGKKLEIVTRCIVHIGVRYSL